MIDGYVWDGSDWVTSATLLTGSQNAIKMKPAPTGKQFLQWNVYVNGELRTDADDVYEPLAEQTRLRNLSRNVTLEATYFTPDTETKYNLTIERKDGSTTQIEKPAGTDVDIHASFPDQGMEFYKWTGDVSYVAGGIYYADSYVHMPAQNIRIKENYVPEGYIPGYDLEMKNLYGQCCYTTEYEDPETGEITTTEHWVSKWNYPEGSIVKIRATGIEPENYFDEWTAINHLTSADAKSIIKELKSLETTLTMPDYDIDVTPQIAAKQTYKFTVTGGGTSGFYYKDYRVDVYFGLSNTNDVHYEFIRWASVSGTPVYQLELYDGGMFSATTPGTQTSPQYIKAPGTTTEIRATYKTKYRLTLTGGTIDETSTTQEFYETGTTVNITADQAPAGTTFQYWSGDTSRVGNIYDPTTTVRTTNGVTNLTAVYSTNAERNGIGYVTTNLKNINTIDNEDITIISGEIEVGFIITDVNGHIYLVTAVDTQNDTSTIYRMTKIVQGGNIYG